MCTDSGNVARVFARMFLTGWYWRSEVDVTSSYWCPVRMSLEVAVINAVPGKPFINENALHGGTLVAGRLVWF